MFGVDSSELLLVALIALLVIGPKDLPKAMRVVGQWVGRARGMARHFRSGLDTMMREAELEEMEKKWRDENERIMREFPAVPAWDAAQGLPPSPAEEGQAMTSLPEPEPGQPKPEQDASPPPPAARNPRELP